MSRETTIAKYIEAVREVRSLKRALDDEPSPARAEALAVARVRLRHAEAGLNGTMLSKAKRELGAVEK